MTCQDRSMLIKRKKLCQPISDKSDVTELSNDAKKPCEPTSVSNKCSCTLEKTEQNNCQLQIISFDKQSAEVHKILLQIKQLLEERYLSKENVNEQPLICPLVNPEPVIELQNEDLDVFMRRLNLQLEKNYQEFDVKIDDVASHLGMSVRQINRKLKILINMPLSRYLCLFRLRKAKILLERGRKPNQVSFDVGFSTHTYFGQCFKAQFGLTPSQYYSIASTNKITNI